MIKNIHPFSKSLFSRVTHITAEKHSHRQIHSHLYKTTPHRKASAGQESRVLLYEEQLYCLYWSDNKVGVGVLTSLAGQAFLLLSYHCLSYSIQLAKSETVKCPQFSAYIKPLCGMGCFKSVGQNAFVVLS